jgi:phospholipase/carboxylesterase
MVATLAFDMIQSKTNPLVHRTLGPQTGNPPFPGLLLLHGRGSNEMDLLSLGPALDPRLFVISARGPFTYGPGAYYWYDLEASLAGYPTRDSIEHSLELIRRLVDESVDKYSLDATRVFLGGFSMGGAMTAATALMFPRRIAGGLIFSGYVPIHSNLPFDFEGASGLPIFQAHGTLDDVLPIGFGRASRDFLQQAGTDLSYHEFPIGHTISPPELEEAARWIRPYLNVDSRRD